MYPITIRKLCREGNGEGEGGEKFVDVVAQSGKRTVEKITVIVDKLILERSV